MNLRLTPAEIGFLKEVARCQGDFRYFARKYLKIVYLMEDETLLIPFELNASQEEVFASIQAYGKTYVLKARRLGISTFLLGYCFWKILFTPDYNAATLCHTKEAAEELFKIAHRFYEHLPSAFKLQFKLTTDSKSQISIKGGGTYRVGTAGGEGFRGSGLNFLHLSEFAHYTNVDDTLASVYATLPPGARVVYETSANGLNRAYDLWRKSDDGIKRLFFPWTQEPRYVSTKRPQVIPKEMVEYGREHNLTEHQLWWATETYTGGYGWNLQKFNQEFPANDLVAFTASGTRVFLHLHYPEARNPAHGLITYEEPIPFHVYSAGADPAGGGPDSDFSAWCVLDVTKRDKPRIVQTYYERIPTPQFAQLLVKHLLPYKAVLAVERNNHGHEILNRLVEASYPYLYRKEQVDKVDGEDRWTTTLGFDTSTTGRPRLIGLMHQYIGAGILDPKCPRLMHEINTFEHGKKREEAAPGAHDDLLFATALALEAMDQTHTAKQEVYQHRPTTHQEVFAYQKATGKKYNSNDPQWEPDPLRPSPSSGMRSILGRRG